jgi:hypothetical protein
MGFSAGGEGQRSGSPHALSREALGLETMQLDHAVQHSRSDHGCDDRKQANQRQGLDCRVAATNSIGSGRCRSHLEHVLPILVSVISPILNHSRAANDKKLTV